jgi:hypothetical protein
MRAFHLDSSKFASQKAGLARYLQGMIGSTQASLRDALETAGAEAAEELSARTFPSSQAIGLAVAAMRFDLSLVYCSAGKAFEILKASSGPAVAGRFYGAYKRGELSAARKILTGSGSPIANIPIGEPLNPALREKVRDRNGRVKTQWPLQIVTEGELSAYAKHAIEEIGKTAAGWSACAGKLGGDANAVAWKGTARHGSSGGEIEWSEDAFAVRLMMKNTNPLARKHLSPGQAEAIMKRARERVLQLLESRAAA